MSVVRFIDVSSAVVVAVVAVSMGWVWFQDRRSVSEEISWTSASVVSGWDEVLRSEAGVRVGRPDASVVIAEFIDYQCPFCARRHRRRARRRAIPLRGDAPGAAHRPARDREE